MAKSPHTSEWRAMVAQEYLDGNTSSCDLAKKYNVDSNTVIRWAMKFKEQGNNAFINTGRNNKYTANFKIQCVELFITGKMTVD